MPTLLVQILPPIALVAHVSRHTKEKPFKCNSCNYTSTNNGAIAAHVKAVHKRLKDFLCPSPGCNFSTTSLASLKVHRQRHDPNPAARRPFPCKFPKCNYRGATTSHLNSHIHSRHNLHGRSRTFICPLCSRGYLSKAMMVVHVRRVHNKEKIYKCDQCDFATHDPRRLTPHMRIVHGKGTERKKYTCASCEYFTYRKGHLHLHTRTTHRSERRFSCDYAGCSYKTNYRSALRIHALKHETSVEKQFPFVCSFPDCGYRGRLKSQITAHEREHRESDIQLPCKLCPNNKTFPNSRTLRFHERMVHGQKIFTCHKCDFVAFYNHILRHHLQSYHGLSPAEVWIPESVDTVSKISSRSKADAAVCHKVPLVLLPRISLKFI